MDSALVAIKRLDVRVKNQIKKLDDCQKELEQTKKRLAFAERPKTKAKSLCAKKSEAICKSSSNCTWVVRRDGIKYCRKK